MGHSGGSVEAKRSTDRGGNAHKMDSIQTRVCVAWVLLNALSQDHGAESVQSEEQPHRIYSWKQEEFSESSLKC